MSRHEIIGRKPGTKVVVGWDPPLMTYFVQVFDRRSTDGIASVWIGGMFRELYELEDLKRAVEPHAEMSVELAGTLYGDRDEGR